MVCYPPALDTSTDDHAQPEGTGHVHSTSTLDLEMAENTPGTGYAGAPVSPNPPKR